MSSFGASTRYMQKVLILSILISLFSWMLVEPVPIGYLYYVRPPLYHTCLFVEDMLMRIHARSHSMLDEVPITIIAIDEASLRRLGSPIRRAYYAKLIRRLSSAGAKVIAVDVLFVDPSKDDAMLASALKEASRSSKVVIASTFLTTQLDTKPAQLLERFTIPSENIAGAVTSVQSLEMPIEVFASNVEMVGVANLFLDEDGVCRRMPLLLEYGGKLIPTFTLAVVCSYLDTPLSQLHGVGKKGIWLGEHFIQTQPAPAWFGWENDFVVGIDFRGAPNSTYKPPFKTYSFMDALRGSIPAQDLAGRIALVGAITPLLPDFRPTPIKPMMSGVEVFAHAITTLLSKTQVKHASSFAHLLLSLFVGVATCLILMQQHMTTSLLWAGVVLTACFAIPQASLKLWHIMINPMGAFISWVAVSILIALLNTVYARSRVEYFVNLISHYVSPHIARELAKASNIEAELRGRKRELTILFSDIRGFTSISHSIQPYETVSLLSRYFTVMSEVVYLYGGMVNNIMGDGMMVLFGIMPEREDHAERAVAAAWHMIEALQELQFEWERITGEQISIGIGVNTGEAVVGDISTPYKGHFTAIGDCVNLAHRLEQATKELNCSILIGKETYERVGWMVVAEEVQIRVKGFDEPITAYKLIGLSEEGKRFRSSLWVSEGHKS